MDDLILMIFKTHQHEWLTAQHVKAIVNAIKGTNILLTPVKKSINRLIRHNKVTRLATQTEEKYMLTDCRQGFYL